MAVRADITADFTASPRVITIASPSTTLDIVDLIDTMDALHISNPNEPQLYSFISTDGLVAGLNAFLDNAVVSFEARSAAPVIECTVTGGSLAAAGRAPFAPTKFTKVLVSRPEVDILTVKRFLMLHAREDLGLIAPIVVEGNFYIDNEGNFYIDSQGNRYIEGD